MDVVTVHQTTSLATRLETSFTIKYSRYLLTQKLSSNLAVAVVMAKCNKN